MEGRISLVETERDTFTFFIEASRNVLVFDTPPDWTGWKTRYPQALVGRGGLMVSESTVSFLSMFSDPRGAAASPTPENESEYARCRFH